MTEEEWDRVITVNLKGAFLVARAGVRQMLRQESGSMIFTVSGLGIQGRVGGAHYAASKGGMIALLRSMAAELRGTGVRVNGVSPGPTDTAMSRGWRESGDQAKRLASGEVGQPEDIVGTVIFLASDLSKDLTGQVILRNYRG
jgi:3-oxoacyl-[acyl-carrier protein] reductase